MVQAADLDSLLFDLDSLLPNACPFGQDGPVTYLCRPDARFGRLAFEGQGAFASEYYVPTARVQALSRHRSAPSVMSSP